MLKSEEVVLGESLPLSELLLAVSAASSAAMDIIRSSSGVEHKNTQSKKLLVLVVISTEFGISKRKC